MKWKCWLLGHKLVKPWPNKVYVSEQPFYLFEDRCKRCGMRDRFWNSAKELGDTSYPNFENERGYQKDVEG